MHLRWPEVTPLKLVGQPLVVQAEAVQNRCIEVKDRDWIAGNVVAEIVRLANRHTAFDASSGQPKSKPTG